MLRCVSTTLLCVMALVSAGNLDGLKSIQYCDAVPDDPSDPPPLPTLPQQYTANLEVITKGPDIPGDSVTRLEFYMEEVYDEPANLLAVEVRSRDDIMKHILNWNTKRWTEIRISKHGNEIRECVQKPLKAGVGPFLTLIWGSGPNLSVPHTMGPAVLNRMVNWTEAQYKGKYPVRGMTAGRWDWCGLTAPEDSEPTYNISMATYWSDRDWKMGVPGAEPTSFPLQWDVEINKGPYEGRPRDSETEVVEHLVHNIMFFRPGVVDHSAFQIPPDLYCEHLEPEKGNPFPDFANDHLFTFSMEMRETGKQDFTWVDAWYDFEKQLYRTDHDVSSDAKNLVPTTQIFDFTEGIAFTFAMESPGYAITIINDTRSDWVDITGINHLWADNPNAFFGADNANYTYYSHWSERYIKGEEWRAARFDWPTTTGDEDSKTLWQWIFTNKNVSSVTSLGEHVYLERQIPIGLRVTAMDTIKTDEMQLPKGYTYVYQIYDFNLESAERSRDLYSDGGVFDVSRCYSANWKDHLKFKLNISSWPEVVDTPLLTAGIFSEYWQKELAFYGTVSFIRITRVKTIWEDSGEVWVEFLLLYRHPQIGMLSHDLYESMTPGEKARQLISVAIDDGNIKFEGEKHDGKPFTLVAEAGSLTLVIEPICTTTTSGPTTSLHSTTPHTTYPVTTTTTTTTTSKPMDGTTMTVKPEQTTTSTEPKTSSVTPTERTTPEAHHPTLEKRFTPGDLAGLGVGMLMAGLAAGAGTTYFITTRYIPKGLA